MYLFDIADAHRVADRIKEVVYNARETSLSNVPILKKGIRKFGKNAEESRNALTSMQETIDELSDHLLAINSLYVSSREDLVREQKKNLK